MKTTDLDPIKNHKFVDDFWQEEILPSLSEYIRIPNKSPMFDPDWEQNGFMLDAANHMLAWVRRQNVSGLSSSLHTLPSHTPVVLLCLEGELDETVLIYGHLDKQPEFTGWDQGLGPWDPVLKNDGLYGRGGADDGYAIYAALASIIALKEQALATPRIVILIEASEESGSPDLADYMLLLESQIGQPGLVIALDSTCGNYDRLWVTTSLRGMLVGDLNVKVLDHGVHSGAAGGIVPSSFRLLRQLVSRLEDENNGNIKPSFLNEQIPSLRRQEAVKAGIALKNSFTDMYPFAGNGQPMHNDPTELVLSNTWAASLAITGIDGAPPTGEAGNVLRPNTTARLALRIPPTTDAVSAAIKLHQLFTENPPNGAEVSFALHTPNPGWHAPLTLPSLASSLDRVSKNYFNKPAISMGCGGSIPFMEFLASRLPLAQFVVTGVLGPHSNAHGPNEYLHLPTAQKLTACVAELIYDWGQDSRHSE